MQDLIYTSLKVSAQKQDFYQNSAPIGTRTKLVSATVLAVFLWGNTWILQLKERFSFEHNHRLLLPCQKNTAKTMSNS